MTKNETIQAMRFPTAFTFLEYLEFLYLAEIEEDRDYLIEARAVKKEIPSVVWE